jgi:thiol-disulfide isomerase/thioredoxin
MKKIFLLSAFISLHICYGQEIVILNGKLISDRVATDTVFFTSGLINSKYYETPFLRAVINKNQFTIENKFTYPQMYFLSIESDKDRPFIDGYYFVDNSSTKIILTANAKDNEINGTTATEYIDKFKPYVFSNNIHSTMESFIWNNPKEFDAKLSEYIKNNANSYVGLWFLISRIESEGFKENYSSMLNALSKEIKLTKIWKTLDKEQKSFTIRGNQKFPNIILQNTNLKQEILAIPNARYTLIDFWFSRCRPCLEIMPKWIELYNKYNSRGFNVIGISSDKTENVVPFWQVRIIEMGIPWKNYLDENGVFCNSEKIKFFPTNFLLNEKGEVIEKNIEPETLAKLLEAELK